MSIHSTYCNTQYIDSLKLVSMPVSLSCVLQYNDTSMYHPISSPYQHQVVMVNMHVGGPKYSRVKKCIKLVR